MSEFWWSINILQMPWKDIVTIAAASVGAILGIMNTWNTMSQRRIRLRVTPVFVTDANGNPLGFSIEAINLSAFPIVIAEMGFAVGRRRKTPVQDPRFRDGSSLPRKLEARDSLSVYFEPGELILPKGLSLGKAYVRTACGRTIYGDSPARKQFSKMLTEITAKHG